jgi:hypothetical protein
MPLKPDADRIMGRLQTLRSEAWLGQARSWWPDFLFHVTDVQNAAKILAAGQLLSRARCETTGAMAVDNASERVLGGTDPSWKEFVRFYFRPKTPFQYQTEGFRPIGSRGSLDAYCPMPIVFLFDAPALLGRADSRFSDGNLAVAQPNVGDDAVFFESLPFQQIYHDSWLTEEEKRSVVYHRHAEVIVPDRLDLSALRRIWCRSPAEQETLRSLVSDDTWSRIADRVGSSSRPNLFYRQWTFVEAVVLSATQIEIRLNPWSRTPGPFVARIDRVDERSGEIGSWTDQAFSSEEYKHALVLDPALSDPDPRYSVRLWLDERLAYAGAYSGEAHSLVL